jgi:cell division protein FtsN
VVPPVYDAPGAPPPQERVPAKSAATLPVEKPAEPDALALSEKPAKVEIPVKAESALKLAKQDPAHQAAPAPSPAAVAKAEQAPAPTSPSTARVAVALAPAAVPTPRAPSRGDWSVQVSATRDPRTADTVLRRLRTKGYDAFVLKVRRRGETFYRVRVGHYESLEDAQQVVSRLRREPGVPEAFVASD